MIFRKFIERLCLDETYINEILFLIICKHILQLLNSVLYYQLSPFNTRKTQETLLKL